MHTISLHSLIKSERSSVFRNLECLDSGSNLQTRLEDQWRVLKGGCENPVFQRRCLFPQISWTTKINFNLTFSWLTDNMGTVEWNQIETAWSLNDARMITICCCLGIKYCTHLHLQQICFVLSSVYMAIKQAHVSCDYASVLWFSLRMLFHWTDFIL